MATDAENMLEGMSIAEGMRNDLPDDLEDRDLIALFVLDDIPNETLSELLDENAKHITGNYIIWLADSYDTLPDYNRKMVPGTSTPINLNWRSPFVGKTIPDVVAFMRATPKPPKVLNKRYCAVLTKDSLKDRSALICKSLEDESDVESDSDDDESDEDDDELIADQEVQPGTIEADLLQQGIKIERREFSSRARNPKLVVQELGNDYENVQVAPIAVDKVAEFQYIFERQRWTQFYLEWREDGVELG